MKKTRLSKHFTLAEFLNLSSIVISRLSILTIKNRILKVTSAGNRWDS